MRWPVSVERLALDTLLAEPPLLIEHDMPPLTIAMWIISADVSAAVKRRMRRIGRMLPKITRPPSTSSAQECYAVVKLMIMP